MFFKSRESKRFDLGDLVYDEFYGSGLVIDFDKRSIHFLSIPLDQEQAKTHRR